MRNLLQRGGLPDLLSPSVPVTVTPRGFLLQQRFVPHVIALRALAASVERLTSEPDPSSGGAQSMPPAAAC